MPSDCQPPGSENTIKSRFVSGLIGGLAAALVLAGCQSSPAASGSPRVRAEGVGVSCPGGDHAMQDAQLGWSFCYPGTWRFRERAQSTTGPAGMDLTFDITDVSGSGPTRGEFGYMIIGTYERGSSQSLQEWVASNVGPGVDLSSLTWGNSEQAGQSAATDQWFALTTRHVVEVTMREGDGNLPLSQEMRQRLGTWKFSI